MKHYTKQNIYDVITKLLREAKNEEDLMDAQFLIEEAYSQVFNEDMNSTVLATEDSEIIEKMEALL